MLHRIHQLLAELGDRNRVILPARALRIALIAERRKLVDRDARDRVRVLEGEEETPLRALVGPALGDVHAVEEDLALGDLVGGVPHQA